MTKRIASIILAVLIISPLVPAQAFAYAEEYAGYQPQSEQQYNDVPPSHWAFEAIATCSNRDWFNGYPDGTFRPTDKIRRDEAAKVFALALGIPIESNPQASFSDTHSSWAKAYIESTQYLFPDSTTLAGTKSFRPEQTITREETIYALVVAWRYASKAVNADLSILNMFSDSNSISQAVKPYVSVAVSEGLVSGIPDGKGGSSIQGQTGLSRAEFATLLARALEHGIGPDTPTPPVIKLGDYPSTTSDDSVTIQGRVSNGIWLTCDDRDIQTDSNGDFSIAFDLNEGPNSFVLKARNAYGVSTISLDLIRNSVKPSIRILNQLPQETSQATYQVTGIIEAYSDDCMLLLDNKRIEVEKDGHFQCSLALQAGENVFQLEVIQQNQTCATYEFRLNRIVIQGAGEWLEQLPAGVTNQNASIETKTQARSQTREITTSPVDSMDGWSLVQKDGSWGPWSPWQTDAVTDSDTRKVETQEVQISDGTTQYRYYAYVGILNSAGAKRDGVTAGVGGEWRHFSSKWMDEFTSNYWTDYTPWLDHELTAEANWYQVYAGQGAYKYRYDGKVYYNAEVQTTDPIRETQYRYQDYTGSNVFERWSEWSDWTDASISEDQNTRVQTRTVYRFTPIV